MALAASAPRVSPRVQAHTSAPAAHGGSRYQAATSARGGTSAPVYQRLQFGEPIASGKHDDDREGESVRVLLMLDAALDRDERIELLLGRERQEQPVSRPA